MRRNGLQRSFRFSYADAILQPSDDRGGEKSAIVKIVLEKTREHLRIHTDGNPDLLGIAKGEGAFEPTRSDANHCVGSGVQGENPAKDTRIGAEFVNPHAVT